jgi:hypothetical protein
MWGARKFKLSQSTNIQMHIKSEVSLSVEYSLKSDKDSVSYWFSVTDHDELTCNNNAVNTVNSCDEG